LSIDKRLLKLYLVTDSGCIGSKALESCVEEAVKAGATLVQLREKKLANSEFIALGKKIKAVTDKYKVPLIINDNIDVVLAVGADGIHIGQDDIDAADARAILGGSKIIGVTAKTVAQAVKAEKDSADYLGVGAMFGSPTKTDALAIDLETARQICAGVKIPCVAIGGINESNIEKLSGIGFCGVAAISAILASENITSSTKSLLNLSEKFFCNNTRRG